MENGVSKKVNITSIGISGVLGLAANAENKVPFALIVAGMFVVFMICQVILDRKRPTKG